MRRAKGGDYGLLSAMAKLYTRSQGAGAMAAMAVHLGLGEVRLASTSPYLVYVVDAPPGPSLEALAAYATVVMETSVTVLSLQTIPVWRRTQVWNGSPVACVPEADMPITEGPPSAREGPEPAS